jgi:hypothetical protein
MATTIWTDDTTGLTALRFTYDATTVQRLKTGIPKESRRWDPDRKLWLIDPPHEPTARRILGLPPKTPKPKTRQPTAIDTAVTAMFDNLPTHLHDATYKALIRIWHPDIGGDTRATQALNAWRTKQETA